MKVLTCKQIYCVDFMIIQCDIKAFIFANRITFHITSHIFMKEMGVYDNEVFAKWRAFLPKIKLIEPVIYEKDVTSVWMIII